MKGLARKILIVDAHPVYIQRLESFVKGFTSQEIALAKTGKECLEKIHAIEQDLVIMSAMLPDMDAHEICKTIKQTRESVRIIVQVGLFSKPADKERLKEFGADIVLDRKEKDLNPLEKAIAALVP